MSTERVEFPGSQSAILAARFERPAGALRATALFAHCFTCGKDGVAASRIARELAARGIGVLRFDFTGLGGSDGDFANTSFSSNLDDLVAAAAWLEAHHEAPSLLVGHSLGGSAVLAVAERMPSVRAVATIGAPADPADVKALFRDQLETIDASGEAEVRLAGRPFRIRRSFVDDLEQHPLEARIARLRRALLVLHAPLDDRVGIDNATRIFAAAKHPKSFISLDDADHLLSRRDDAAYAAETIAAWASRFLPAPEAEAAKAADQNEVVVREAGDGLAQDIFAGPHRLRADEPPAVGGADTGPTPYGLLLSSLGACTTMTLRMYARRKKWPLERATVRLRHEKIHGRDCAECETEAGKIDRIERSLTLEGPLDAEQRQRLLEIADRCPVHRTLHAEVRVDTTLEA